MASSSGSIGSALMLSAIAIALCISNGSARVLEFGEEFLSRDPQGAYLIKFYAPWCGHCRSMEAAYEQVSELLADSPVTVARIDATVHQAAASHFRVRGFPTVVYVKGDTRHEFRGERSADEMVKFVNRVAGDPVKLIASPGKFSEVLETSEQDSFFLFVGSEKSDEFAMFNGIAGQMRTDSNFYRAGPDLLPGLGFDLASRRFGRGLPADGDGSKDDQLKEPCVMAFKNKGFVLFKGQFDNDSLGVWMTNERFLIYPKVGEFLFYSLYPSTKLLVAMVINETDPEQRAFVDLGRGLAFAADPDLANVQFAWTGSAKAASDLAMTSLPTPNVVLLNPNTSRYHLRPDYHLPASAETAESVKRLLLMALAGDLPGYGGNGLWEGLKRTVFDFVTGLASFIVSHPGLALVVVGAPVGVVSILCYALCCMDTDGDDSAGGDGTGGGRGGGLLDDDDEEDEEEGEGEIDELEEGEGEGEAATGEEAVEGKKDQ